MGVCEVGRWLKDASGGWGLVIVVLVVMVVRRARRGRRKVGGRVEREGDDWQSAFHVLRANILTRNNSLTRVHSEAEMEKND